MPVSAEGQILFEWSFDMTHTLVEPHVAPVAHRADRRRRDSRLHRRLGLLGAALATTMIAVGYRAAIDAAHRGFKIDIAHDPLAFLVFPLGDLASFAVLVALAL